MKPSTRSVASALTALALVAHSPAVLAQAPPPQPASQAAQPAQATPQARADAEAHFKRGLELFDEDDFQGARIEFARAYQIAPNYRVLYNLGQVNFQLQDYVDALKAFERYLAEGANAITPERRQEVERDVAKLRLRVASVAVTAPPGAVISVDGAPVGTAPLPGPVHVSAGRRVVRAVAPGRETVERTLELAGGDSARLDLVGQPSTDTGPTPPPSPEPTPSTSPPWLLWGLTGALVAGAAVTGVLALSASSSASDIRNKGGSFSDYDSAEQRMRTLSVTTDIIGGVAIVVAGIATYLTVTAGPKKTGSSAFLLRF
jgi:hypothetical protein